MKAKSQVCFYAIWEHLILKMQHSATRQSKQKISPNLDNHWSKKSSFLCVQTNWVCPSGTQRFSKNDSDSSHWLWLESSHSVKNVTRAESSHYCIQRDSSRVRVTKNRDSSRVIDLSHAITGDGDLFLLLTFCQITYWFYQSVVQLLGHWPYAFQHVCSIAAMNISNLFLC